MSTNPSNGDRFAHLFQEHEPWKVSDPNFRTPGYKGFVPRLRFQSGACFSTTSAVAAKEFAENQTRLKTQNTIASARSAPVEPHPPAVPPPTNRINGPIPRPQSAAHSSVPRVLPKLNVEEEKPWLQDQKDFRVPGYAGFVPHSAAKCGKSFTTLTRRALEEFKDPSTEARHEREAAAESLKARLANISVDIYNGSQTERIERSSKISSDLASGRMSVPAAFTSKPTGTMTPEDTPRSRFHIRGYKGHIAGAVHLCGESFSRISEKALQGKHVETLNISDKTALNFPQPLPAQYVDMLQKNSAREGAPPIGHIQGYKGFIPNRSSGVAVSFGRATIPEKRSWH